MRSTIWDSVCLFDYNVLVETKCIIVQSTVQNPSPEDFKIWPNFDQHDSENTEFNDRANRHAMRIFREYCDDQF